MKTTVAVCKANGKAKSTPLLEMANVIMQCFPNFTYLFTSEEANHFTIESIHVIKINEKVIAFDCRCISANEIETCLETLVKEYKCHLIFCRFETLEATQEVIKKITKTSRYDLMLPVDYNSTPSLPSSLF